MSILLEKDSHRVLYANTDGYLAEKKIAILFYMPRRINTLWENDSQCGVGPGATKSGLYSHRRGLEA